MMQRVQADIGEWIVRAALAGIGETEILAGVCERLDAAGISLMRASIANDLLDPTFDGRGVRWNRGEGGTEEVFARAFDSEANEAWTRSTFFALVESGLERLRLRLDATYRRDVFPLLDGFQDRVPPTMSRLLRGSVKACGWAKGREWFRPG